MKRFLQFFLEDLNEKFKPTVKWMEENYKVLNELLFDNELGKCHFGVFTTGKGSQGKTYGWFSTDGCFVDRNTRQMYIKDQWGDREYATRENFYELLNPRIELNGNYSATEDTWLHVLAHEMVHYYTYMDGFCPKQGHGPEFRRKANEICDKSDGWFSIERFITADMRAGAELDDELKQKKERRLENRKNKAIAVFVYYKDGSVQLSICNSDAVVKKIYDYNIRNRKQILSRIVMSNSPDLIGELFKRKYRTVSRTYRYWTIPENFDLNVNEFEHTVLFDKSEGIMVSPMTTELERKKNDLVAILAFFDEENEKTGRTGDAMLTSSMSKSIEFFHKRFVDFTDKYYGDCYISKDKTLIDDLLGKTDKEDKVFAIYQTPNRYRSYYECKYVNDIPDIENFFKPMTEEVGDIEITSDMNLSLGSPLEKT